MKQSPYQAFPVHQNSFQGTASSESLSGRPYKLLHVVTDTDVTVEVVGGGSFTISNLPAGFDIVLPGNTATVTTTGEVIIS